MIRSKRQRELIRGAFENGYDADVKRGKIWLKSGRWTFGIYNKTLGYMMVSISLPDGPSKGEMVYAHRLVAYKKYGDKIFDPNLEVRHKNGDGINNKGRNLLLGTRLDNIMDMPAKLRSDKSKVPRPTNRLFTQKQARRILRIYAKNKLPSGVVRRGTAIRLAARYNVSAAAIRQFVHDGGYRD